MYRILWKIFMIAQLPIIILATIFVFLVSADKGPYSPYSPGDGGIVGPESIDTPVCNLTSSDLFSVNDLSNLRQTSSSMAILKSINGDTERFVITWQSTQDGSGLGVFAKLFDVGTFGGPQPFTDQFLVNTVTIFDQKSPEVAALDDGSFVIVYESTVLVPTSATTRQQRIIMQIFDRNGNAIGPESLVSDEVIDRQDTTPSISAIKGDNPGFVVSWISTITDATRNILSRRAMARVFSADGSPRIRAFQANSLGDTAQPSQSVSGLLDGTFIIAWTTQSPGCITRSVNGQRFDQVGQQVGPQFPVSPYSPLDAFEPFVLGFSDGSFAVSWSANDAAGVSDIYMQKFSKTIARVGNASRVNEYTNDIQSGSVIAENPTGGFLILWNSFFQGGNDFGIYGQFYDSDGSKQSTEFQVNINGQGAQTLPSAVIFPGNQVIISWTENSQMILGRELQCRQDCVLSQWTDWGSCSNTCGGGFQNRTRSIVYPPSQGGQDCGSLFEQRECNLEECPNPLCAACIGASCFVQVPGPLNYQQAQLACQQNVCPDSPNCLASIQNREERSFVVSNVLLQDSWIESWQGEDYGDLCLSISKFGAITIPPQGCSQNISALCEIGKPAFCT